MNPAILFQNPRYGAFAIVVVVMLVAVGLFVRSFLADKRKVRYGKMLVEKTEGAQKKALSVLLDAESRALKDTSRDKKLPFDLFHWSAIKRDLKRAGLPRFPPLVYLASVVVSWLVAMIIVDAPIYPIWAQAVVVFPAVYFLMRVNVLGMFIESRKLKMMIQLVIFIESTQRSITVGTSPDEAVNEAIRETEQPLRENLTAIKELLDLGFDFVEAIRMAADRVNLPEFDIFAASMAAQSKTGGSIGKVLLDVIEIARSRIDMQRKISTMTAEGRFNALLLGSLPIMLTLYLRHVQAKYFNAMWHGGMLGPTIFFLTLFGAVFGSWLAMKIAKVTI